MAVIPRPASTVVLMDQSSRVYLTKRPVTMKFMGGFHVFPGGAVEKNDKVNNNDRIINGEQNSLSLSYYVTAARELFEEVGVLLGKKEDGSAIQLLKVQANQYRQDLLNGDISFFEVLERERLYLDLHRLTYFGQIITPEEMPIRFDTRFFLAKLPKEQNPDPDRTEIDEAIWIKPEDALEANDNKQIKLAPPTIISLQTIINYQNGGELMMSVTSEELIKLLKKQH